MKKSSQIIASNKRKASVAANELAKTTAPQQVVRFQVDERPAKRRYALPADYAPVRQPCIVDAAQVTGGRQELWLIQLPNVKAMQTLAALGSVEMDLQNAQGALASFQGPDGNTYRLQQESGDVSHQLVAVCSTADEAGAAQPAPVARRLTLVRASEHALFGGLAGELEDEEAALARLKASLAAMEEARRESEAIAAMEGGLVMPAPDATENGATTAAATPAPQTAPQVPKSKDKRKEKSKDKGKDKEKDKSQRKKDKEGHKVTPAPSPLGAPAADRVTPGPATVAAAAERSAGKESGKAGKGSAPEAAKTPGAGKSTVGAAATPKSTLTTAVAATPKQSEPVAAATPLQGGVTADKPMDKGQKAKKSSKKDKHKDKKKKKEKKEKKVNKEKKESKSTKKKEKKESSSSGSESE